MNIFNHPDDIRVKDYREKGINFSPNYKPIRLLLDITSKLSSTFINSRDKEEILKAVLVGITSGEGLRFNRAFFFELDLSKKELQGKYAIGPSSIEDAHRIWNEISTKRLTLFDILDNVRDSFSDEAIPLNKFIKRIKTPLFYLDHPYALSLNEKRTVWVRKKDEYDSTIRDIFGVDEFVVVPVVAGEEGFGIIHADNYVTRNQITHEDVDALQLFASLASIAVSRNTTCGRLEEKVDTITQLNEKIERNKEHLLQAERCSIMGRITDQIVHEMRNPLAILGGMAKILTKRLDDKELKGFAEIISNEVARLEESISNLTIFSQTSEPVFEKAELWDLIKECLSIFNADMERQNIVCHSHMQDKKMELVMDQGLMKQALVNIIKNALEAMPWGGLLSVCVNKEMDYVKIIIADTGIGIAKGHLKKADEPFFTTKTSGMGLGLSLSKHYINLNKGYLKLSRNRHGGTSVIIAIPSG